MNDALRAQTWRVATALLLVAVIYSFPVRAAGQPSASADGLQIWFVRHAESELSVTSSFSTQDTGVSYPLTKRGVEQALQLADSLANTPVLAIYTSTRLRAIQTADALAFRHAMTVRLAPEAAEIDTGIALEDGEFREKYRELTNRWLQERDINARYQAGESLADVQRRFLPFVRELMNRHAHDRGVVVVVSHSGTLGLLVPMLVTNVAADFGVKHPLANVDIIKTELRDNTLYCLEWGSMPQSVFTTTAARARSEGHL